MNIFRFTISRLLGKQVTDRDVVVGGKTYQHTYVPASSVYESINNPLTNEIVWPAPPTDPYDRLRYDKYITTLYKDMLRDDERGHVDILSVDGLLDLLEIGEKNCIGGYRGMCAESYRKLRATHCVHFIHVPPEIIEEIPTLFNRIFGTDTTRPAMLGGSPQQLESS